MARRPLSPALAAMAALILTCSSFLSSPKSDVAEAAVAGGVSCMQNCPADINPVCGTNGKTYDNECLLIAEAECKGLSYVGVLHSGPCEQEEAPPVTRRLGEEKPDPAAKQSKKTTTTTTTTTSDNEKCEHACPFIYDPVCGSNGETFGNECIFRIAKCYDASLYIAHKGPCEAPVTTRRLGEEKPDPAAKQSKKTTTTTSDDKKCEHACPFIYDPVCGSNGETFDNECIFRIAKCYDASLYIAHKGPCEAPVTTRRLWEENPQRGAEQSKKTTTTTSDEKTTISDDEKCERACPFDLNPVCGSNGVTYDNECIFRIAQCYDASLSIVHEGPCEAPQEEKGDDESPTTRLSDEHPPKTDGSEAEEATRWLSAAETHASRSKRASKCIRMCSPERDPICGSDGTTYTNMCIFDIAQCLNPTLTIVHKGECQPAQDAGEKKAATRRLSDGHPSETDDSETKEATGQLSDQHSPKTDDSEAEEATRRLSAAERHASRSKRASKCIRMCSPERDLICGSDGTTYTNMCIFDIAQCLTPTLTIVHKGECQPAQDAGEKKAATRRLSDGHPSKTDDSETKEATGQLSDEHSPKTDDSEAKEVTGRPSAAETHASKSKRASKCIRVCHPQWDPICASDGITYPNKCIFDIAQCLTPTLIIVHSGACPSKQGKEEEPATRRLSDIHPPFTDDSETEGIPRRPMEEDAGTAASETEEATRRLSVVEIDLSKMKRVRSCLRPCPLILDQVCGSDGTTYPNKCVFEIAQCVTPTLTIVRSGPCEQPAQDKDEKEQATRRLSAEVTEMSSKPEAAHECIRPCPPNLDPVCGSNGTMYPSKCVFENAKCVNPTLTIVHSKECEQPTQHKGEKEPVTRRLSDEHPPQTDASEKEEATERLSAAKTDASESTGVASSGKTKEECMRSCPRIWKPLCASNGTTYGNRCLFEVAQCVEPSLTVERAGTCEKLRGATRRA